MLTKAIIPGYGPYVFGCKRVLVSAAPAFVAPMSLPASAPLLDYNAIRLAAKSLHPVYAAEENVLANDSLGDCTCAGALHITAILQAIANVTWRSPTPADAIWLYSQVTNPPFNPVTKANDNGADLEAVLEFWRTRGVYSDGSGNIKDYAAVDATNPETVKAALIANRNLYMGADLPKAWIPEGAVPKVWDLAGDSDPDYGHCIIGYSCNDQGVQVDSWGCFITITWAAMAKYFGGQTGEVYSVVAA